MVDGGRELYMVKLAGSLAIMYENLNKVTQSVFVFYVLFQIA
jgi:hypothetical protein